MSLLAAVTDKEVRARALTGDEATMAAAKAELILRGLAGAPRVAYRAWCRGARGKPTCKP